MLYSFSLFSILEVLLVIVPALLSVAYVTVAERKTMASMQRRVGPNKVGVYGLLQAFADALKLILKEYVSPTQANLILFFLGPIITLIFSLLGYAVIPYGPGLAVSDYHLGILYMLAVSSLATYGILLAGLKNSPPASWDAEKTLGEFQEKLTLSQFEANHRLNFLVYLVIIRCIRVYLLINKVSSLFKCVRPTTSRRVFKEDNNSTSSAQGLVLYITFLIRKLYTIFIKPNTWAIMAWFIYLYMSFIIIDYDYVCLFFIVTFNYSTNLPTNDKTELNIEDLKALHFLFIKELYKDREAPVKPFDRKLIKATCYDCLDKEKKSEFLSKWGSKGGIYIIEYKYDPLVYYIGRTTNFRRRFNNHLQADTGNKLHVFLNLVGWQHFNLSIIEECSLEKQGERENYYLQNYLPLLNTTFSSSFSESAIYKSLTNKLTTLRLTLDSFISGQSIPVYVYEIKDRFIHKPFVKYDSITVASSRQGIARGTLGIFRDTNVPFRGKLYYSQPIEDFVTTFNLVKNISSDLKLNSNIAKEVWAYDAKTLELVSGSPFSSKTIASRVLGISRNVINYFIDSGKAEGIKGTYLFSRQLDTKEIKKKNTLNLQKH